ncbi:MAG: sulfurtransferase complex subunit TusB [Gammaproteobacteria bacterium]|nr:sulfurtransferase complex subunit TusB [Gammaproteobacteria bacterium]
MLHTVNKSPFERDSLGTCFRLARQGSDVLLIEDAVYAALAGTRLEACVREAMTRCSIYVLKEDVEARGICIGALIPGIETVDYGGFVDLAVRNDSVQSWL